MKTILSVIGILATAVILSQAASPVVTNVVATQRAGTKFVDIRYDAIDADGDSLKISVEISHTAGRTFNIPAKTFTGDYGDNVAQGTNKLMTWNAGLDWDGEYSTQMVVKIIASDTKGFPGLEWGSEVPLGGFLMGQEGGAEGIGPSKHVNIPWSYWFSKYEITCAQYCEFLNIALAAGKVVRVGTTSVKGNFGASSNATLITLGDGIVWNVNSFEVYPTLYTNHPVIVPWYGAIAWAQFFGYDLPTDAEWEKAARGPDHAGVDQHQAYPWGNTLSNCYANYNGSGDPYETDTTPVGYYNGSQIPTGPDMANSYGIYDVIGNVAEWTRSTSVGTVEDYPLVEDLMLSFNAYSSSAPRIVRGGSYYRSIYSVEYLKCYMRQTVNPTSTISFTSVGDLGFRVTRRNIP
jgi:formylglycine-generating enzyme required for sulfatase activity